MKTELVQQVINALIEELEYPSIAEPECESPIEEIFLREFEKVAKDDTYIRRQYKVETDAGRFRLDFVVESLSLDMAIGIECDGRDFHSAECDSHRDAAIIAADVVDKVYRLRGRDINFRIHDLLELLAFCEPGLFSKRGIINLRSLSHRQDLIEDYKGPCSVHFPFIAIREYFKPDTSEFIDTEITDYGPFKPAVIFWT